MTRTRRFRISNFDFSTHWASRYAETSPHTEEPQRHREDTEENTEYFSTGLEAAVTKAPRRPRG